MNSSYSPDTIVSFPELISINWPSLNITQELLSYIISWTHPITSLTIFILLPTLAFSSITPHLLSRLIPLKSSSFPTLPPSYPWYFFQQVNSLMFLGGICLVIGININGRSVGFLFFDVSYKKIEANKKWSDNQIFYHLPK